jgi:hypothetical protein
MDIIENSYSFCEYLVENVIPIETQLKLRQIIKDTIISNTSLPDVMTIDYIDNLMNPDILFMLFELYDTYFYENKLKENIELNGCSISICANNTCTSTAGVCKWIKGVGKNKCFTIELSKRVFVKAFTNSKFVKKINGGLECIDLLDCFLLTFEHELLHAILMCFCPDWTEDKKYVWGDGNKYNSKPYVKGPSKWTKESHSKSGHSSTFMSILYNMFGQTDYKHGLFGIDPIIDTKKLIKHLNIGDIIKVRLNEKQDYKDIIDRQGLIIDKIKKTKVKALIQVLEQEKDHVNKITLTFDVNIKAIISINDIPVEEFSENIDTHNSSKKTISSAATPPTPPTPPEYVNINNLSPRNNSSKTIHPPSVSRPKYLTSNNIPDKLAFIKSKLKIKDIITFEGKHSKIMTANVSKINIKNIKASSLPGSILINWVIPIPLILTINGITIEELYSKHTKSITPKPITPKPKTKKKKFNVKKHTKMAGIVDKQGKSHKSKVIKAGQCIFPFKYKGKIHNDCIPHENGDWCPTIKLKPSQTRDTWGYCE